MFSFNSKKNLFFGALFLRYCLQYVNNVIRFIMCLNYPNGTGHTNLPHLAYLFGFTNNEMPQ